MSEFKKHTLEANPDCVLRGNLPASQTQPAPALYVWFPENCETCKGVIVVFPGGGYAHLAPHEGHGYALELVKMGWAACVVEYRVRSVADVRHPAMLEDAASAIYTVRSKLADWGLSRKPVGVMGSSAGGHLAAHISTAYLEFNPALNLRPDFSILCYPVISMMRYSHQGSCINLLGEGADEATRQAVSPELLVNADTPPAFVWHLVEDPVVPYENCLLYTEALKAHGVRFELHLYPGEVHGVGMNTDKEWAVSLARFLHEVVTTGS